MSKPFALKNDAYRKKRGGYARFLTISCESCAAQLFLYQKDGPGELKRMYIDRIVTPKVAPRKKGDFTCPSCKKTLGIHFVYEKEKRPAIRLFQGSVVKKVCTGRA